LTGYKLVIFNSAREILEAQLKDPNSACAKFLKDTLGFSGSRIAKALRGMRAFDGEASTITLGDAGLLPHTHKDANTRTSNYFATPLLVAAQARYASSEDRGASPRDVYFGVSFFARDVLHEVLHIFTGLDDKGLAARLGVEVSDTDTSAISTVLKNAGCGD
jgi:hypothetical protein